MLLNYIYNQSQYLIDFRETVYLSVDSVKSSLLGSLLPTPAKPHKVFYLEIIKPTLGLKKDISEV